MILKSTRRKSVASVPSGYSGQEQKFAQSVSEELDTLSGRRGNIIDRAVTFRDLLDTGVLKMAGGLATQGKVNVINPNDDGDDGTSGPTQLPTQPSGLTATGGFGIVFLNWSLPPYRGHDYIEIFRFASNNVTAALAAGSYVRYYGDAYFYTDTNVTSSQTWYYWVRAVNIDGVVGPMNSSTGTSATTAIDYVFIAGLIDQSLSVAGRSLGLHDTITAVENDITTVNTTVSGLSSTVTTLNTTVSGNSTSIQTNATSINGIEGKYSVKIDNNGHVSGFGLISTANDGTTVSSFIVAADRFAIARPTTSSDTGIATDFPFKVVTSNSTINGATVPKGVYIDDGFIHNAQITNALIQDLAVTTAKINDLSATKITSGNIQIDAANDIKIYQGKTSFNSNTSGFWLGLNNNAGSFHIGASGTKYLKFDGNNGDLITSGIEVRASDNTVLLDAGGLHSSEGLNSLFNGSFVSGLDGWTSGGGTVAVNTTLGRVYTDAGEYIQSDLKVPVSPNEPLYLYADFYGANAYGLVAWFKEDGTYTNTTISTSSWNPSAASSQKLRVAKIDYPSYTGTDPWVYARVRFGTLSGGATTTWHQCGLSKAPPVIDPSYSSTYIRDLSVDTLQIAGNAVTLADQTSTFPTGTANSKKAASLETGQMPENSAFVWFINAIVNQVSGNPSTYDLNIEIYTKTTSGSYVLHASRTIWVYSYGLDARIIKEEFPPSHNGDGFMKCEVNLYEHNTTTLVTSGAIELAYVGAKK